MKVTLTRYLTITFLLTLAVFSFPFLVAIGVSAHGDHTISLYSHGVNSLELTFHHTDDDQPHSHAPGEEHRHSSGDHRATLSLSPVFSPAHFSLGTQEPYITIALPTVFGSYLRSIDNRTESSLSFLLNQRHWPPSPLSLRQSVVLQF